MVRAIKWVDEVGYFFVSLQYDKHKALVVRQSKVFSLQSGDTNQAVSKQHCQHSGSLSLDATIICQTNNVRINYDSDEGYITTHMAPKVKTPAVFKY